MFGIAHSLFPHSVGCELCIKSTPVRSTFRLASAPPSLTLLSKREKCPPPLKIAHRLPLPSVVLDPSFHYPNFPVHVPDSTHMSPSKVSSKTERNLSNTSTVHRPPRPIIDSPKRPQNLRPHPPITTPTVLRHHHRYPGFTKPPTRPIGLHFHALSHSQISTGWRLPLTCVLRSNSIKNVRSPSSNSAGNTLTPVSAWGRHSPFPS